MSRQLTQEDVIQNKKSAIKTLNNMLEGYINDPTGNHLKKANLISYWIKDYVKLINFEEHFDPTKNIAYKRGNVVKLNFGFNIGSEYGGLHYGIVLDNNNHHSSPVITVIPLTSVKDTKRIHSNSVELGNELYRSLKLKYDTISKALNDELEEIETQNALFNTFIQMTTTSLNEYEHSQESSALENAEKCLKTAEKIQSVLKEKALHNQAQREYLSKIGSEISKMKEGSIALVNQISTVSKMRIFDPRNLRGVLAGISLSEENMEKINEKLKELYVFQ